jgi:flagellar biosynthesis/type III secretory pathway chaperone
MPADPLAALLRLLDDEREGLLRGRLAEVAAVADRKARLIAALNAAPDPAGLVRVKAAAERNQRLLEAAAAGVKDVRARLAEVRQSAGTLATYTPEGARQTVSTTVRRDVERRL